MRAAGGRLALACAAVVALALLSTAGGAAAGASSSSAVPLSSSALLFYTSEFEPHYGQPISQCSLLLRRAKEAGSNSVNIVPTSYWMTDSMKAFKSGNCYPDNWAVYSKVDYLCQRWEWDNECGPWTPEALGNWTTGIKACIKEAHDFFDEVMISPHLDDGAKTMYWRNMLRFDPFAKDRYGWSYWQTMINPILSAVKEVYTKPGKTFIFAPVAEMGATVAFFPQSYQRVADTIRAQYSGPAKVLFALPLNHAYVPGVINRGPDPVDKRAGPPSRLQAYQGWGALLPFDQWLDHARLEAALPALRRLLSSADVIGVSCYPRVSTAPRPEELETCAAKLDAELRAMGFDLKAWSQKAGKRFIFSEVGLGGGISRCGDTPARTRAEAGTWANLDCGYPPRAENDAWARPELKSYRRDWHAALLKLLASGGVRYPVSGAYLWSIVSMDPQGIHPATTVGSYTFADPQIAEDIKRHNAAAVVARVAASAAQVRAAPSPSA